MSILGLKKLLLTTTTATTTVLTCSGICNNNINLFKCSFSNSSSSSSSSSRSNSNRSSVSTDRQNEMVIEYLRSTKIKYCQGWSTFNLYVCPKAEESFHLNKNTGYLNFFKLFSLFIVLFLIYSGDFHCLKCNKSGCFNEFKELSTAILKQNKYIMILIII